MGKSAKPWLHYKSHEDEAYHTAPKRELRNYRAALLHLLFLGVLGGHKFYLYDEKRAWKIFGLYLSLMIGAAFLKPLLENAPLIVLVCYAVGVIFTAYPTLKADVERINQEIKND